LQHKNIKKAQLQGLTDTAYVVRKQQEVSWQLALLPGCYQPDSDDNSDHGS